MSNQNKYNNSATYVADFKSNDDGDLDASKDADAKDAGDAKQLRPEVRSFRVEPRLIVLMKRRFLHRVMLLVFNW